MAVSSRKRSPSAVQRLQQRRNNGNRFKQHHGWTAINGPRRHTPLVYRPRLYRPEPSQHAAVQDPLPARSHSMLTRTVTTQNTRTAVLSTYELLEAILLQCRIVDLVKFRRVNKTWNHLIIDSKKIAQKMFLRANNRVPTWLYDKTTSYLRPYGPSDAGVEFGGLPSEVTQAWLEDQCKMRPAMLNPLFCVTDPEPKRPGLKHRAALCESIRFSFKPNTVNLYKPNLYNAMFLSQPPTFEVQLHINYRRKREGRRHFPLIPIPDRLVVQNKYGVRLGDVLHAFRQRVRKQAFMEPITAEYEIELVKPRFMERTAVWMLGAIFVSDDEYDAVQRNQEVYPPSPLAKEMMSREKAGVHDERYYNWWSQADGDWVEKQEKMFGRPALGWS